MGQDKRFARIRGGEETEAAAQASSEGYKPTDFQEQAKDEGKETLHRESLRNRLSRAHRIIDCGSRILSFGRRGTPAVTKEDIFTLSSHQIVEVYDGDTFKIDLPGMHALFGDNLSIRVLGIDTPEMKGTSDQIKALAIQAREITEKALLGGTKIELRNAERGKYFRVVAEVWIDGESLADTLKAKGLAKDYDGEGPRPEWGG